jgi:hypothetical protein
MSVLMVLRIDTDGEAIERVAKEHGDTMKGVAERGRAAGAIHHAFYAGDGEVVVVDEWPDEQTFLGFFESENSEIGQLMQAAGVTGEPSPPRFYRKLDTGDDF